LLRDRYHEQVTIWLDEEANHGAIARNLPPSTPLYSFLAAIVPAGTITRRASHKLWLTSTNAKDGMLGSELKSMVECSEGWKLVGADVDSQEQWIAAIFGDSITETGHAGSTLFSRMQLAGTKANSTDLHSVVAKEVKISRNNAKTLNYARLYGSGQHHAREFLIQQGVPEAEAHEISSKLFERTKGIKWR
jgi:DNA polymerase gamma 1